MKSNDKIVITDDNNGNFVMPKSHYQKILKDLSSQKVRSWILAAITIIFFVVGVGDRVFGWGSKYKAITDREENNEKTIIAVANKLDTHVFQNNTDMNDIKIILQNLQVNVMKVSTDIEWLKKNK